jgi:RND family efflux transporter MFP subunit
MNDRMPQLRLSGVVVFLAFLAACSGPYSERKVAAKGERPVLPVAVTRVAMTVVPEVITANGELFAEEQATISTKVPGRVLKLNVDLGSPVGTGDVLGELEKDDYEFRVKQAEALVEQTRARLALANSPDDRVDPERTAVVKEARAALEEARVVFETTERLQKEGVVSRVEYERALARRQGLEARVQSALAEVLTLGAQLTERRAQLSLARQQLQDTTIRAPFGGAITRRVASLGEYLGTNAPVVTLVRQHPLRVRLEVPERQAARIRQGQLIEISVEGSRVGQGGRVVRISPAIEAQNRSLLIEGEIPNANGALRPGSFVEGTVTVNAQAQGILIPRSALVNFAGIERVFVVKGGVLEDRILKTARRMGETQIEVVSGLADGDEVVTQASDKLVKGQKVTVRP